MKNKLRTIAEYQFFKELVEENPKGILSLVSDTFDLFTVITEFLPRLKPEIMARDGKLVIRPDSGDPVDIICGLNTRVPIEYFQNTNTPDVKGVIELLWDIFGGTINEQGYKVLDSHIGAIYGDSINLDRQIQIYERLEAKGFASTNIVLGVGSYTYQMNTRDTLGFAAKGAWFEVLETKITDYGNLGTEAPVMVKVGYDIFKDPVTDNGTKKSLKGRCAVHIEDGEYVVKIQCTEQEENEGILHTIYEDGKFYNQTTLADIRTRIESLI
jgi:nicotinamide phosphoribosyltransferase